MNKLLYTSSCSHTLSGSVSLACPIEQTALNYDQLTPLGDKKYQLDTFPPTYTHAPSSTSSLNSNFPI